MKFQKPKRNTPIATLIRNYVNKKSGKVSESRSEIKWRFDYLDWKDQKQILTAFLDSCMSDREWAYSKLLDNWDETFEPKVKELWENYHEYKCSWSVIRYFPLEYIKEKLHQKGLTDIEIESAGVYNYEGSPRDYTMTAYARKAGYELGGTAHYVTQMMVDSADLIICMEHSHIVEIQKRLPYVRWSRIYLFNEICFGEHTGLIDPTGNTGYMYHYALGKIQNGCEILAWKIEMMVNEGEFFFQRK